MKRLLVLLLPFFLLACSGEPSVEPVSKPEALAFAASLDSGIRAGNVNCFADALDAELLARDVAKELNQPYNTSFRDGLVEGLRKKRIAEPIIQSVRAGGMYNLVRQYEKDGVQHVIFRLYGSDGLNYHDFSLAKRKGEVKARDFYILLTGENMSKTLASLGGSFFESGLKSGDLERQSQQLQRINRLMNDKQYASAKAALDALPAKVKQSRAMQVLKVTIAGEMDSATYKQALGDFEAAFGGEPASQFALFDLYFMKHDFARLHRIIDAIDNKMQDPLLDFYRAILFREEEKYGEAGASLERLYKAMPDFEDGVTELIANYVKTDRVADANRLISDFKANPKFKQESLGTIRMLYPDASPKIEW